MELINKEKRAFQYSQQSVNHLISHLDQNIWDKVALKTIEKMPRSILTSQTNKVFKDFAFVNTELSVKAGQINEESDKSPGIKERQLGGFIELIKKQIRHSVTQNNQQPLKKLSTRRKHKKSQKFQTQEPLPHSDNLSQTKANTFYKLLISEPGSQEQHKNEEMMRNNKYGVFKYNQQLQKIEKEQKLLNEQRSLTEQKKMKESKEFTYDYQGRILAIPPKKIEKLKICNMKPYFENAAKAIKMKKLSLHTKQGSSQKATIINNKRLIGNESKLIRYDEEGINSGFSHKGRLSLQNNLTDLFKGGKDVEMGVSITDMGTRSKICGDYTAKQQNRLKLTQYKMMRSSFKPIGQNLTESLKHSQTRTVKEPLKLTQRNNQQRDLFVNSDSSSKVMSSSFSHFLQRSGRIKKNQKVYTQIFE